MTPQEGDGMEQKNVYDAIRDIWADETLAQDVFEFSQCNSSCDTQDAFVVLQRELDPRLIDAENRIEAFEDEVDYRMAIVRQVAAEDAEMGMNIISSKADDAVRETLFAEKILADAIKDADRFYQPEIVKEQVEMEDPVLGILRSWYKGLRRGRILGATECDWLTKLVERFEAPLREKLQVRLGALMCLELAARGGDWQKDAASTRKALDGYNRACVEVLDPGERLTEKCYLSEGEMVSLVDFVAEVRSLAAHHDLSLEEAIKSLLPNDA